MVVPMILRVRRVGWMLGGVVSWAGLWVAVLSASPWMWLSVSAAFLSSLAVPVVMTSANGIIQVLAPTNMRARLLVLWLMVSFGLQPIAALLVGYIGQLLGAPEAALLNGSALMVGAAALLIARPELRRWQLARPGDAHLVEQRDVPPAC